MFPQAVVATLVALPFFANSVLASDCARTYTVVQGDICDRISSANNVSTYQLAAINPNIDKACGNITPGQVLCLGTVGEDCATTYVVRANDTCEGVASAHGLNATIMALNNPQIDAGCSNIYIGEVLAVCDTVLVPPVPAGGAPAGTIPATAVNPTSTPVIAATPAPTAPASTAPASTAPAPTVPAAITDNSGDEGSDDDIPEDQLPFCEDEE